MKKVFTLIAASFVFIAGSKAQFDIENLSVGAGLAPSRYFVGFNSIVNPLIKAQYELDDESLVSLDLNFPSYSNEWEDGHEKLNYLNINVSYGRYFVGDAEESFNLFWKAGVGISQFTYEFVDPTLNSSGNDGDYTMNFGVGTNLGITDNIQLFAEPTLVIGAGQYNSMDGYSGTMGIANIGLQVGAKFRFN
jgi:hypothetical protein